MQQAESSVSKDLVLVGGGHSHVAVLKSFGMRPMPGVNVTLISNAVNTPYSGMLPGYIAGHYTFDEAHIDLRHLCHFAGAAFYHATVTGLDLENRRVCCAGRAPVRFDLLSINTGSTPRAQDIPGALEHALRIKPIDGFLRGWDSIVQRVLAAAGSRLRIAVVGGGAGGVELTLATQHRLRALLAERGEAQERVEFHLLTDSDKILPTHNARVRAKFIRILRERGVFVYVDHRVVEAKPGLLICCPGEAIACDVALWATNAAAPAWIRESGLKTDAAGFLAVDERLQSPSHPFVFGAGDVAAVTEHPRAKSGVFAVRQGPPLMDNLRRALNGQPPRRFVPQKNFLSLISTGNQYAVASRGPWALEGRWVWRLKNWIDVRWMRQYQELPFMEVSQTPPGGGGVAGIQVLPELAAPLMRCGGCGAKVGSAILARVLQRLTTVRNESVVVGLDSPDDAAVSLVPPGQAAVQTVDVFRSFLEDPYLFGRIAANHSLGDIFAMGATPQSALAIAVVPYGCEARVEERLYQLLSGAVDVLNEHHTQLAGGHTAEGAELMFGLVVNGVASPDRLLRKGGVKPGDQLILTKPLGTGALFAADMRRRAKGAWIEAALDSMQRSNRDAAQWFLKFRATACTDVTGFGLLGHLIEMLNQSPGVSAQISLDALPLLEGLQETMRAGIFSSLQPQNLRLRHAIEQGETAAKHERFPVLFDPQTAGGLLASVPGANAEACLTALKECGCTHAAVIGEAHARMGGAGPVTVRVC